MLEAGQHQAATLRKFISLNNEQPEETTAQQGGKACIPLQQ